MRGFSFLASLIVFYSINEANGIKITGKYVNFTEIMERAVKMGTNMIDNFLPDLTYNDVTRKRLPGPDARRYLMKYISDLRRENIDKSKQYDKDDFTDYDESPKRKHKILDPISKQILKSIDRRFWDLKIDTEDKAIAELVKEQHERRMQEINEFMKDHWLTTSFLHKELRRIKRDRVVIDPLREMIEYLEEPGKDILRTRVLKCFHRLKSIDKTGNVWAHDTNNLVLNTFKDPYNDGFIN